MSAQVVLSNGAIVVVDEQDLGFLSMLHWHQDKEGYAATNVRKPSGKGWTKVRMHRMLVCVQGEKLFVDHIDGNKLNNSRNNLRKCDAAQNQFNRKRASHNKSGLKGVHYYARSDKWIAQIQAYGTPKHLGYFGTAEEAHEVYCLAADMLHGEFANHGA